MTEIVILDQKQDLIICYLQETQFKTTYRLKIND